MTGGGSAGTARSGRRTSLAAAWLQLFRCGVCQRLKSPSRPGPYRFCAPARLRSPRRDVSVVFKEFRNGVGLVSRVCC
ncbi:MAG: hypothetical protein CMJ81_09550 [Planctomycetaceae bacterium]|nr:hypothetical protein [Planctomycetaceae bacterium]